MRHKETPIAELTLRKYEKPYKESGRALVKKLCLSLGLLQPGDSRDVIIDVAHSILYAQKPLSAKEIEETVCALRTKHNASLKGITAPNIRRQIRRLKDVFLIERKGNVYSITEGLSLPEIMQDKIEKVYLSSILSRVKEYCESIEKERSEHGMSTMRK